MIVDQELNALRELIDKVDTELLALFNKRMELSLEVGRVKQAKGLPLFHPGREEVIFERLSKANPGPLREESLRSIYREIMAASRLLQYTLQVAYLGPEWTYSHLAALSLYGHSASYVAGSTPEDVVDALLKGKVRIAVIPIENSIQGGVGRSMDLLYEQQVSIVQECYLETSHYLCANVESLRSVKRLYAHHQAVEQCRRWILENLRQAELHETSSTAWAAQLAKEDPQGAAVCNLYAAHHYKINILAERIEDHPGNTTRFLALANHVNPPTGNDKTSLLFAVSDQPGALHAALEAFARNEVNMTRIESRPNRILPWQYLFYSDIEGHQQDEKVQKAFEDLKNLVTFLKVLGSYPKSDPKNPIRFEKEKIRNATR